jgi:hypothetical protein
VQIQKDKRLNAFNHFTVLLTSLTASSPSGNDTLTSSQFPIQVVLDSGTTLSYLPNDIASQIWQEVGAIWVDSDSRDIPIRMAALPCSRANNKGFFTFGFAGPDGPQIRVGMDELVLDLTDGAPLKFSSRTRYSGQDACMFGIQNFSTSPFLLGDTFLRSAYVVYDLVNNEIGLAATDFNATESNLVPFPSQGAQIPSATAAPNQDRISVTAAVTSPAFAAASGFQSAAALPHALGWPFHAVIAACLFSLVSGGELFSLGLW